MPYVEEMMSIGKAANGYILTIRVPYEDEGETAAVIRDDTQKVIVCKDMDDLTGKIASILPALVDKQTAQEQFNSAFEEIENNG